MSSGEAEYAYGSYNGTKADEGGDSAEFRLHLEATGLKFHMSTLGL